MGLQNSRLDSVQQGASALRGFLKETTGIYKALFLVEKGAAISQIIINLQLEIAKIFAKYGEVPGGQIFAAAESAAAKIRAGVGIATIAAQVFKEFTPPKAERGIQMGVFGGKPHSQGGTKGYFEDGTAIEVERGELFTVINKKSTAMLKNLSAFNQMGGGIPFMAGGGMMKFNDGGAGHRFAAGGVLESSKLDMVVGAIHNQPTTVVRVVDIVTGINRVTKVADRANI